MKAKSKLRIEEIALTLDEREVVLVEKIAEILGVGKDYIKKFEIVRRAVDSRNKRRILLAYSVEVEMNDAEKFLAGASDSFKEKIIRHKIKIVEPYVYEIKQIKNKKKFTRPVVVGSGPCGLFCALVLAKAGLAPIIIERGKDVDSRIKDVDLFSKTGKLNPESNIQFGEGGAGTFSDGKLYTGVNDPRTKFIFEELVKAGAPKEILYSAGPHIGTDKLRVVVKNLRQEIISLGGEFRFESCLTDIETKDDKIKTITINNKEKIEVENLILAIGHSARDTYEMLLQKKMKITAKPFSIGVRIEHKAEMINKAQYGEFFDHKKLSTAKYKLVAHLPNKRSVYTFCMCPGGVVVPASSEEGMLVVNGMSEYKQDSKNSNSALLVSVFPADFETDHPLAGVEFQRKWEKKAFEIGGKNYFAPAQLVGDFLKNKPSTQIKSISSTYLPGIKMTTLENCLPDYVLESLREALPEFEKKIKGFVLNDAILIGVETRSSSPVKLVRNEAFESNIKGIFPAGEGAGYAGGITSSAIDGMRVAERMLERIMI
jgi:uncharacterized FAD-dependent dehydrogenase